MTSPVERSAERLPNTRRWTLLGLTAALALVGGLICYRYWRHNQRDHFKTEARTTLRVITDAEDAYFRKTGAFLGLSRSVDEVPRGTCISVSNISESFRTSAAKLLPLVPYGGPKHPGIPSLGEAGCFRFRYEVVSCPGQSRCNGADIRKFSGSEPFIVMKAEGDLDGDGVTSLFSRMVELTSKEPGGSRMPGGATGFYTENEDE